MKMKYPPLTLMSTFLWMGFVGAISFLEAWLKFRAPGVTLPIGLGIGRLVFQALNKVEWLFALLITGSLLLFARDFFKTRALLPYAFVLIILSLQTAWLLPALDQRASLMIEGQWVEPSRHHIYYVITEVIKMLNLAILGVSFFKLSDTNGRYTTN